MIFGYRLVTYRIMIPFHFFLEPLLTRCGETVFHAVDLFTVTNLLGLSLMLIARGIGEPGNQSKPADIKAWMARDDGRVPSPSRST